MHIWSCIVVSWSECTDLYQYILHFTWLSNPSILPVVLQPLLSSIKHSSLQLIQPSTLMIYSHHILLQLGWVQLQLSIKKYLSIRALPKKSFSLSHWIIQCAAIDNSSAIVWRHSSMLLTNTVSSGNDLLCYSHPETLIVSFIWHSGYISWIIASGHMLKCTWDAMGYHPYLTALPMIPGIDYWLVMLRITICMVDLSYTHVE